MAEPTPSLRALQKILKSLRDNGSSSRTNLSLVAKMNYARLADCIKWLEQRGLVESVISDNIIKICLTKSGRLFTTIILKKQH